MNFENNFLILRLYSDFIDLARKDSIFQVCSTKNCSYFLSAVSIGPGAYTAEAKDCIGGSRLVLITAEAYSSLLSSLLGSTYVEMSLACQALLNDSEM